MWHTPHARQEQYLKKANWQEHRELLDGLGIDGASNKTLMTIGTTRNGLVHCDLTDLKRTFTLSMPVLGPDLAKKPPQSFQIKSAVSGRLVEA
ncbi:hypothetical protein WJX73_008690 [Symbiochloris irregularis]|uniref:Uncharacterized protein n=1 Tax=Symbiochloris irregularis TaxID=706552 RepID=A0AAW1PLR4_9CHLO